MFEYKVTKNQVVWYKDGKRVARKEVPLKEKLKAKKEIEQSPETESTKPVLEKHCVVCGAYPSFVRFYNNQMWEVCEDCYHNKTLGQMAEAVRKKNGN